MKKLITLIFLSAFISTYAQLGMKKKIEEVKEIQDKTLLVVVENEDDKDSALLNADFRKAVESEWSFNKDLKFISKDELKTLRKDKKENEKYAYLIYSDFPARQNFPAHSIRIGLLDKTTCTYSQVVDYEEEISLGDWMFTLRRLQDYMIGFTQYEKMSMKEIQEEMKINNEKILELKTKTLLLDEALVSDKLKKELITSYKYTYQLVSKGDIDKAIAEKRKDVFFIRNVLMMQPPSNPKTEKEIIGINSNATAKTKTTINYDTGNGTLIAISKSLFNAENGESVAVLNLPKSKFTMNADKDKELSEKNFEVISDVLK